MPGTRSGGDTVPDRFGTRVVSEKEINRPSVRRHLRPKAAQWVLMASKLVSSFLLDICIATATLRSCSPSK